MKIEQQVSNLELSKKLKELGVKQESLFKWEQSYSKGTQYLDYKTHERLKNPINTVTRYDWVVKDNSKVYGSPEIVFEWWWKEVQKIEAESISAFTTVELGEMLPEHCKSFKAYNHYCPVNN